MRYEIALRTAGRTVHRLFGLASIAIAVSRAYDKFGRPSSNFPLSPLVPAKVRPSRSSSSATMRATASWGNTPLARVGDGNLRVVDEEDEEDDGAWRVEEGECGTTSMPRSVSLSTEVSESMGPGYLQMIRQRCVCGGGVRGREFVLCDDVIVAKTRRTRYSREIVLKRMEGIGT